MVSTSQSYTYASGALQPLPAERAVCHLGKADHAPRLTASFQNTDAHRALEGSPDFVFAAPEDKFLVMEALSFLSDETTGGWAAGISSYEDTGTFRWLSCERDCDRRALIAELPDLVGYIGERRLVRDFAWGNIRGTVSEDDLSCVLRAPEGTTSIRSRNLPVDYKEWLQGHAGAQPDFLRQHPPLLPIGRLNRDF